MAQLHLLEEQLASLSTTGRPVFNFEDDNLLLDPEGFREAVTRIRRRFPDCRFTAENGLDYRLLDRAMVAFLADSGFLQINLSLGTLAAGAVQGQQRVLDLQKHAAILADLEQHRLPVTTFFICGLPGDSPQETVRTLRYLAAAPTRIGISPFYAVPGLPEFPPDHPGFRDGPDASRGMALTPWSGTHSVAELMAAFRLTRFLNLLKSTAQNRLQQELIAVTRQSGRLHTLVKEGKNRRIVPVSGMPPEMTRRVLADSE